MMKQWLMICFILFLGQAQAQFLQDKVSGKYYFHVQSGDVKGSPFLYDDWRPAFITFANGLQLKNLQLKFDMVNNKPLFLRNDSAFEFVQELWSFIIYNPGGDSVVFKNGFEGDNIPLTAFLQVMLEDKLTLLKSQGRSRTETKGFGVGITTIEFNNKPAVFFLAKGNQLVKLKKTDDLARLMGKDWQQVADHISLKKLSLKKEEDLLNILRFYNSL